MSESRILIIDDDSDICREIAEMMAWDGHEAASATTLESGIAKCRDPFDIVVLDLEFPGADGFQIIAALAAGPAPPALIVASGHNQRIIRAAVQSAEVAGLHVLGSLEKPFTADALLALIRKRTRRLASPHFDALAAVRQLEASGTLFTSIRTAFQSKRRLSNGAVVGYEALARLSVDGISINPEQLFSAAISGTTKLAATQVVLDAALRMVSSLDAAGHPMPVAVNCTPSVLCDPAFQEMVDAALSQSGVAAPWLHIEITEHETAMSFAQLAKAASRLALRGCGIGVDDFGRGAASFERLTDLPLSELKIDKSFFWQCVNEEVPMTLLEEVVRYCAERGIVSVIEGVETQYHLDRAIAAGAQAGQGYYWGRPSFHPLADYVA